MNRFRRKSEASRRAGKANEAVAVDPKGTAPLPHQLRSPLLPASDDFRTSLILPHLTARFALLRSDDGRLVSLETMQQNLEAQRAAGAISSYEVEAVLAQYRLQSMYEEPGGASPQSAPAWTPSWSSVDAPTFESSRGRRAASYATTSSSTDHDHTHLSTSTSPVPFPYSPDPASELDSADASPQQSSPYKRGVNSMFGGRVASMGQLKKMPKSSSAASIKSLASSKSRKGSRVSPPTITIDDETLEPEPRNRGSLTPGEGADGWNAEDERTGESEEADLERETQSEPGHRRDEHGVPRLSTKQLNRISRVLDNVEADLVAQAYRRPPSVVEADEDVEDDEEHTTSTTTSSEVERAMSPTSPMSDTEHMDPFFHSLAPSPVPDRRPSLAESSSAASIASSGRSTPLPSSFASRATATPTPAPTVELLVSSRSSPTKSTSEIATPIASPATALRNQSAFSPDTPSPDRPESNSATPADSTPSFQSRSSSSSPDALSPTGFSFPPISDWAGHDAQEASLSDDGGPFDLSYASSRASGLTRNGSRTLGDLTSHMRLSTDEARDEKKRRNYAATSGSTTSAMFSPGLNGSSTSLESIGSSYHADHDAAAAEGDDDDDELGLHESADSGSGEGEGESQFSRPKSARAQPPAESDSDDDHLRVASTSMSRRPSDELLKDIAPAGAHGNLALEDIVLIQETLVRSAGLKAARKLEYEASNTPETSSPAPEPDHRESLASGKRRSPSRAESPRKSIGGDSARDEHRASLRKSVDAKRSSAARASSAGRASVSRFSEARNRSSSPAHGRASSPMSPQSSDDSYSDNATTISNVATPSSMQSDAFEFSHLAGSSVRATSDDEQQELLTDATPVPPLPQQPPALGAPVELVDNGPSLRVPRSMPPRNPRATQSVLIRDVRNQANTATMQLKKKGPLSPMHKSGLSRFKSVRHTPISHPQLIDAPDNIAVVPIQNPVREDPEALDARHKGKQGSIGLRFKMLLKKQSRDHLRNLNGDEITPFVDFEPSLGTPPLTPPDQHTAQFATTPSDFPHSPDYPETPDTIDHRLSAVDESPEQTTPSAGTLSPESNRSLGGRLASRFRRPTNADEYSKHRSGGSSPSLSMSISSTATQRRPSLTDMSALASPDGGVHGLGFSTSEGRAPVTYTVGSMRNRIPPAPWHNSAGDDVPQTAPLSPHQRTPGSLDMNAAYRSVSPTTQSAPLPSARPGSLNSMRSVDSMRKLWAAAEDLGMPPDKVQELVDLSYAQSPTVSEHHPRSISDHSSTSTSRRRPSQHGQSASEEVNSSASWSGRGHEGSDDTHQLRRANSAATTSSSHSKRSTHNRPSTPPPPPAAYLRKQSTDVPVPSLPVSTTYLSIEDSVPTPKIQRLSMLSARTSNTGSNGSLRPPPSPGASSFRSSGYGSIYDLYGDDSGDADSQYTPSADENVDLNESHEVDGDEVIWHAHHALQDHRASADNYSFQSRRSSAESRNEPVEIEDTQPQPVDTISHLRQPDPVQQLMLRKHRRKTSAQAILANGLPPARFPSIFMREEERLQMLASEGGVAHEENGFFLVRPLNFPNAGGENESHRGVRLTLRDD